MNTPGEPSLMTQDDEFRCAFCGKDRKGDRRNRPLGMQPILLLGEGWRDEQLIRELVRSLQLECTIQVENYEGKERRDRFLSALQGRAGLDRIRRIGLTCDADASHEDSLGALKHSFARSPLVKADISVDYFVLPGSGRGGALETMLLEAVAQSEGIDCVDAFVECVSSISTQLSPAAALKLRYQAWTVSQGLENLGVQRAVQGGMLNLEHAAFRELREFIQNLAASI